MLTQEFYEKEYERECEKAEVTIDGIGINLDLYNFMKLLDCVLFYSKEEHFSKQLAETSISRFAKECLESLSKKSFQ